jgi:hypothetical protein
MKRLRTLVGIGAACSFLSPHSCAIAEQISIVVEHVEPASSAPTPEAK